MDMNDKYIDKDEFNKRINDLEAKLDVIVNKLESLTLVINKSNNITANVQGFILSAKAAGAKIQKNHNLLFGSKLTADCTSHESISVHHKSGQVSSLHLKFSSSETILVWKKEIIFLSHAT